MLCVKRVFGLFLQFSVSIRLSFKNMLSYLFCIMIFYCICGLTQFLKMTSYKERCQDNGQGDLQHAGNHSFFLFRIVILVQKCSFFSTKFLNSVTFSFFSSWFLFWSPQDLDFFFYVGMFLHYRQHHSHGLGRKGLLLKIWNNSWYLPPQPSLELVQIWLKSHVYLSKHMTCS